MKCPYCRKDFSDELLRCPECGRNFEYLKDIWLDLKGISDTVGKKKKASEDRNTEQFSAFTTIEQTGTLSMREYLTRPFRDPEHQKKILTGLLMSLVPLIGQILISGYLTEYAHHIVTRKKSDRLPEWSNWENLLTKGLYATAALITFLIAFLIINLIILLPFKDAITSLPVGVYGQDSSMFNPTLIAALFIPFTIIFFIALFFTVLVPLLFLIYAKTYRYEDFFKFREVLTLIYSNFLEFNILVLSLSIIWIPVTLIMFILMAINQALAFISLPLIIFTGMLPTISAFGEFYHKTGKNQ
jgi:hypothetical protein